MEILDLLRFELTILLFDQSNTAGDFDHSVSVTDQNINSICLKEKKSKAILVLGVRSPYGCETSKLPNILNNWLSDGGEVVSLTR
jgi:hypothetical protein